jgi:hypothetical protein
MYRRNMLSGAGAVALLAGWSCDAAAAVVNAPFGRAQANALGIGMPPIELYAPTLVGNGVADDSVAIKAAHDAAFAAGVREVYVSRQHNAPTAYNLGNVQFRGPGALIGTYRKKVIPISARNPLIASKIVPSLHLRNFSKAVSPTMIIWGDSTGTYGANHISLAEMIWTISQRAFLRDNPGRTINRVNRSIGGTATVNYNQTGTVMQGQGITLPPWFTPVTAPWTGFIGNQTPDIVLVNWGTNDAGAATFTSLDNIPVYLLALPKVPDIIFLTNLPRGTQADAGVATVAALEARDNTAGVIRSYCEFKGYGCIDLHRRACMMRDGFDPCTQIMTQNIASQVFALPATLPTTESDFDLTFTIDNTAGVAFGGTQRIDILLSPNGGNTLRIGQSSGNVLLTGYNGSAGTQWLTIFTSSVPMPVAVVTIQVSVKGSFITVYVQGLVVYEGLCFRHGGRFAPFVQYGVGSGATSITVGPYITSTPQLVIPGITDAEMFGSGLFLQGGNDINHPASPFYETVVAPEIDAISFAQIGQPIQTIIAAGAINVEAGTVKLTGPASGTYAITLAAPRAVDAGRSLSIEMTTTTASNSVTLALTNVEGGTAAATCTWTAAGQKLILLATAAKWEVIKQDGVALT